MFITRRESFQSWDKFRIVQTYFGTKKKVLARVLEKIKKKKITMKNSLILVSLFGLITFNNIKESLAESYYNQKNQHNSLYCNDLNPQNGLDIDSVSSVPILC